MKSLSRYERIKEGPQTSDTRSFIGDFNSVPGCFGFYPKCYGLNNCSNCILLEPCKREAEKK